ncbi:hypothetical protein C1H46_003410 [Malus baccata]|uniref:Uncharacterized protein n=1 Tax=Malus baccata TaxID=106549 RepID=A0A540NIZ1_MALBA|nr:hypothetical protein C1H46_003410 [Malus baccata]
MRYNLSASSLVDMPVVQYPVGSLLATPAPSSSSSSSSDLRPRSKCGNWGLRAANRTRRDPACPTVSTTCEPGSVDTVVGADTTILAIVLL